MLDDLVPRPRAVCKLTFAPVAPVHMIAMGACVSHFYRALASVSLACGAQRRSDVAVFKGRVPGPRVVFAWTAGGQTRFTQ